MRVSREQEREATNTMFSLFKEVIATMRHMPMQSQRSCELSYTLVAPRPPDCHMDLQMPSTSRATIHGWMGGEGQRNWPPAQMAPTPPTT